MQFYKEKLELVKTSDYPLAKYPFEKFNPVQSRVFDFYDKPVNLVVAASTGVGKTIAGELVATYELQNGKAIYLAPLKALAQERLDDWSDPKHHLSKYKISICTGDYRNNKKDLEEADIIIKTAEMLNSKCRGGESNYLKEAKTLVIDEFHTIAMPNRGDHLESGIIKFVSKNPDCRIVALSATMPNVKEIGDWLEFLTNRETVVIQSDYRAVPLKIHYRKYYDKGTYDQKEKAKVNSAINIIFEYPKDKFICFVHTKRTGELLLNTLKSNGIESMFHSADLSKEERTNIEKRFKTDDKFRVIVSTSTLAIGLNLPSRRVIVVGVHRGLQEVEAHDIIQQCGRAGRPKYDKVGDAYVLVPMSDSDIVNRLNLKHPVKSQMVEEKTLAFHINSEIHHRNITERKDIDCWYDKTFAKFQKKQDLHENAVEGIVNRLENCGAIIEEDGLKVTSVGVVSSLFYFSPFDVNDLKRNFSNLFSKQEEFDDWKLSISLANIDSNRNVIVNSLEKEEISGYKKKFSENIPDGSIKIGFCYFNLLNGRSSPIVNALMRVLQMDFERVVEVLKSLDSMTGSWNKQDYFDRLNLRIAYGVSFELTELCKIKNIGKVRAKKLFDCGLKTVPEISKNQEKVKKVLNCSDVMASEIVSSAKELVYG